MAIFPARYAPATRQRIGQARCLRALAPARPPSRSPRRCGAFAAGPAGIGRVRARLSAARVVVRAVRVLAVARGRAQRLQHHRARRPRAAGR